MGIVNKEFLNNFVIWENHTRRRGENMSENKSGGVGFAGLLTIVFIVLKLLKVIAWSWVWVLSPLWICIAAVVIISIIAVIVASR